jgi:hypothetical protein
LQFRNILEKADQPSIHRLYVKRKAQIEICLNRMKELRAHVNKGGKIPSDPELEEEISSRPSTAGQAMYPKMPSPMANKKIDL